MKFLNHSIKDKEYPVVFESEMVFKINNDGKLIQDNTKKIIKS